MAHRYGGPWSDIKTAAVEYYLQCYTKALSHKPLILWYFDAFAGSGDREEERISGGLFEGRPIETVVETTDGSARKAINIQPPFQHFVFIEKDDKRANDLRVLCGEFPDRQIDVRQADANIELAKVASNPPWSKRGLKSAPGRCLS